MDWKNFISILTPCTSTGTFTFSVQTYDAQPNITFTMTATANAGDDEITVAGEVYNCINAYINTHSYINSVGQTIPNIAFSGMPVFSDQPPQPTFYIGNTDHCVSIWSQSRFRIICTGNTTGCVIKVAPSPTLITYAQATNYAPMLGLLFEDVNENQLTQQQIVDLMEISSDTIVRLVNNYFVVANHVHEHTGHMEGSVKVRIGPILDYDTPMVRRPYVILITAVPLGQTTVSYTVDRRLRMLHYRFDNALIDLTDPFEIRNEIKLTYRAGLMNIPTIIKEKIVQVANLVLNDTNVSVLKGGSFEATFRLPIDTLKDIALELRQYRNE